MGITEFVHATFILNPTAWPLIIHLNIAEIAILLARILPHIPKLKDEGKETEPFGWACMDIGLGRIQRTAWSLQVDTPCLCKCPNLSQGACVASHEGKHLSHS